MSTLKGQNIKDEFERIKNAQKLNYDQSALDKDKKFANFLRQNWSTFQVHKAHEKRIKPKPESFPNVHKVISEPIQIENQEHKIDLSKPIELPVNYKLSSYKYTPKSTNFYFFGDTLSINYDPNIDSITLESVSPNSIADFWEELSNSNYGPIIDSFKQYENDFNLHDFGYYMLVEKFSESISLNSNQKKLLTWFLLSKSKYKVRIGYNNDEVYLMISSTMKVYGLQYFDHNQLTFYVMGFEEGEIYAYDEDYDFAYKTFSFRIDEPLRLPVSPAASMIKFVHNNKNYQFEITYNRNSIEYYQAIPHVELKGYLFAQLSVSAERSIYRNIYPVISDLSESEAVNFLLALVQKGFSYKIDSEQFGEERVFYPEEILHYPYSDCEDRAVFFSYLVQLLLGKDIVGLDYPEHVATAIHLGSDIAGDYYMINDNKYVVCDPTYRGAPIGVSMRDLSNYEAVVVTNENQNARYFSIDHLKNIFGMQGEIERAQLMRTEDGKVMAAKFSTEHWIKEDENSKQNKGICISYFDQRNTLKWKWNDLGDNDIVLDMITDKDGNVVALTDSDSVGNTLFKLDSSGKLIWKKEISILDEKTRVGIGVYDGDGNEIARKTFEELDSFKNESLSIRNDNILVVLSGKVRSPK
ncbi:MAG: hypothetical protein ABJO02_04335 [Reichenbachiella sp.]|uniref:hypothetical protein n=1 Tax=Reichenbachiella sp. TaxID=2184521 RepID=UPI003298CE4D